MTRSPVRENFNLETPATCRIRVQGSLDSAWSERLGGMRMTTFSLPGRRSPS